MQYGLDTIQTGINTIQTVAKVIDYIRSLLGGMHPDFTFAREDGSWSELLVVRFTAKEEPSRLFRYEITLLHRDEPGRIDLETLVGQHASQRIATNTSPAYRIVHGIVTEAEELATVPEGMLYQVILEPPLAIAEHRKRSRVFVGKPLREIIDTVVAPYALQCDGDHASGDDEHPDEYIPARFRYAYRITDTRRIDSRDIRWQCAQYHESDFAFLSRLLEDEGISYHFEHGPATCVLVFSDADEGKLRLDPFSPLGPGVHGRDVTSVRLGQRLRPKAVRLRDYDWRKPSLELRAHAGHDDALYESHDPGGFIDKPAYGEPLAKARQDRFATEATYASGSGTVRVLSAGTVFKLDHNGSHHDGEYLVTALRIQGEQTGMVSQSSVQSAEPFRASFDMVRRGQGTCVTSSRFRPARDTPKPRIHGTQTAIVTDEPGARGVDVHVGGPPGAEIGCVRLRFSWDDDPERHAKEPTSCWVRVSHIFAGAGRGAMFHPRVGDEVIVEFIDGDPDRPIVTGRVYNGQNRPTVDAHGAATVSAIRSRAIPGGSVIHEIAFDDTLGREKFGMTAGRDMSTTIGHDQSETITNHSTSAVGVNRTEHTGAHRASTVGGNNTEHVGGNETIAVDANQITTIGANQSLDIGASRDASIAANDCTTVGGEQRIAVGASRSVTVAANESSTIGGNQNHSIGGARTLVVGDSSSQSVAGSDTLHVAGSRSVVVDGSAAEAIGGASMRQIGAGAQNAIGANASLATGGDANLAAGGSVTVSANGALVVRATSITLLADTEIVLAVGGSALAVSPAGVTAHGPSVALSAGTVDAKGGLIKLN